MNRYLFMEICFFNDIIARLLISSHILSCLLSFLRLGLIMKSCFDVETDKEEQMLFFAQVLQRNRLVWKKLYHNGKSAHREAQKLEVLNAYNDIYVTNIDYLALSKKIIYLT